ncbi:FAD-binding oxidoreductase [Nonomuraea sp. NPDC003201]
MTTVDIAPFSLPGTPEYAAAGASFQLAAPVDPAGAFTARSVDDVVRAVATARRSGRLLRLTTTGHAMGRTGPLTDSLLLRLLLDGPVHVDPATRTARIPAGKTWGAVLPELFEHGLTAVHGSSSTVGVIGYLLGGGLSFYGRRFGLAANSVRSLTVVLAGGEVVEASAMHRPDLFWALRGGGGGFGVVVGGDRPDSHAPCRHRHGGLGRDRRRPARAGLGRRGHEPPHRRSPPASACCRLPRGPAR